MLSLYADCPVPLGPFAEVLESGGRNYSSQFESASIKFL